MKILLAVDGSPYSTKAVSFLASHLEWFKGDLELHLLHVKAPIPIGHARSVVGKEALEEYYREEARNALAPSEKQLQGLGIPFKSHYHVGDVAEEIQVFSDRHGIDMVVMGSHGHGAFQNLVMGSVATKVLASTKVPVLIVR